MTTLLAGVPPEPLQPLADRLRAAAAVYPFLRSLLLEAAQRIGTEGNARCGGQEGA